MRKINPTKLLVEDIHEVEEKSKGGILLPTAVLKPTVMKGKILIRGNGTPIIEILYREGEIVIFRPNAGTKFVYDDKELRLIDVSDVLLGEG
jgi:co-chaperonin GroES (HSP10)